MKLEFSLNEPVESKEKARLIIDGLCKQMDLRIELVLYSLSFAVNTNDHFIHKMILHFRLEKIGEKFFEKIENETERFSNIIKNLIEKNVEENIEKDIEPSASSQTWASSTSTESICVINDNLIGFNYIENEALSIETDFFADKILNTEEKNSIEEFKENNNEEYLTLEDSTSSEKTIESSSVCGFAQSSPFIFQKQVESEPESNDLNQLENDFLEINSDKRIDPAELDSILTFFENKNSSGGNEIADFFLDSTGFQLNLKFKLKQTNASILDRKYLEFNNYKFQVATKFKPNKFKKDRHTIALSGLPNELVSDMNLLKMFVENLSFNSVKQNQVTSITRSKCFSNNTFFIQYKNEIVDISEIKERLATRLTFKTSSILLHECEQLNSILVKPFEKSKLDALFFNEPSFIQFKCLRMRQPFYLIEFDSEELLNTACHKLSTEMNELLYFEKLFSLEILNTSKLDYAAEKKSCFKTTISSALKNKLVLIPIVLTVSILLSKYFASESLSNESVENQSVERTRNEQVFKPDRPYLSLDLTSEPNINILNIWPDIYLKQFKKDLNRLNAKLVSLTETELFIECSMEIFDIAISKRDYHKYIEEYEEKSKNWKSKLIAYLNSFFRNFSTKIFLLKDPVYAIENTVYNRLRVNLKRLDNFDINGEVELAGYEEQVNELISRFDYFNKKKN